jgi:hypothetical protein
MSTPTHLTGYNQAQLDAARLDAQRLGYERPSPEPAVTREAMIALSRGLENALVVPVGLAELAASINRELDALVNAEKKAESQRLRIGRDLIEASKLWRSDRNQRGTWGDWCAANIKRSMRDIQRLMAIAGADDPVKALEDERAKTREAVAAHRAKATYVSRIPPAPPVPTYHLVSPPPMAAPVRDIVLDASEYTVEAAIPPVRDGYKPDLKAVWYAASEEEHAEFLMSAWLAATEEGRVEFMSKVGLVHQSDVAEPMSDDEIEEKANRLSMARFEKAKADGLDLTNPKVLFCLLKADDEHKLRLERFGRLRDKAFRDSIHNGTDLPDPASLWEASAEPEARPSGQCGVYRTGSVSEPSLNAENPRQLALTRAPGDRKA